MCPAHVIEYLIPISEIRSLYPDIEHSRPPQIYRQLNIILQLYKRTMMGGEHREYDEDEDEDEDEDGDGDGDEDEDGHPRLAREPRENHLPDSNFALCGNLRIEFDKLIKKVSASFSIDIIHPTNDSKKNLQSSNNNRHGYGYDHSLNYGFKGGDFDSKIKLDDAIRNYSDGINIKIRLSFNSVKIEMETSNMITRVLQLKMPEIFKHDMLLLENQLRDLKRDQIDLIKNKNEGTINQQLMKIEKSWTLVELEKTALLRKQYIISEVNNMMKSKVSYIQITIQGLEKRLLNYDAQKKLLSLDIRKISKLSNFSEREKLSLIKRSKILVEYCGERLLDDEQCIICMESRRKYAFQPCGHLSYCQNCINMLDCQTEKVCPMCFTPYQSNIEVKNF